MVVKAMNIERNSVKYRTIMGIDSSSLGIAWVVLYDGFMVAQGSINLQKIKGISDKLRTIHDELIDVLREQEPDHVFIEQSIFVKSPGTARTLSYIVGAIMCIAEGNGFPTTDVAPQSWKSWLGYKNLSSKFVRSVSDVMGRIEGKKYCDKLRKSQTWRVIQHNFPDETAGTEAEHDNNIADAWGISLFGTNLLQRELLLEKTSDITLDLEEFGRLGIVL